MAINQKHYTQHYTTEDTDLSAFTGVLEELRGEAAAVEGHSVFGVRV